MSATESCPFDRYGPLAPLSPVVLSVPHAGRDYPLALRSALRLPERALVALEDRHVDAVALAARDAQTTFVARRARAWIDLNRAEHERDPRIDDGAAMAAGPVASAKVRAGLGLVPARVGGADIWTRRLAADEVAARIALDHRPYHAALAEALRAARARFGIAVLLDIHSMPPIAARDPARIVIGDRFGRSAAARFVSRIEAVARGAGLNVAANAPYAGGHILQQQAQPGAAIHAVQLELDRSLYLDATLDAPGAGFEATVTLLRAIIEALTDEALPQALAAE